MIDAAAPSIFNPEIAWPTASRAFYRVLRELASVKYGARTMQTRIACESIPSVGRDLGSSWNSAYSRQSYAVNSVASDLILNLPLIALLYKG